MRWAGFRLGGLIFHLFMWETFQSSQATEVSTVLAALPLSFWMVSVFFVKTKTCSLSQRNYTVQLATVYKKQFQSVGSEVPGGNLNLQLKCQDGIDVHATLTDATDTSNQSPVLSLDKTSTVRGVGLKIYKDDSPEALRFGPDSSVKGNINQWQFSTYRGEMNPAVSLNINYIRTGKFRQVQFRRYQQ